MSSATSSIREAVAWIATSGRVSSTSAPRSVPARQPSSLRSAALLADSRREQSPASSSPCFSSISRAMADPISPQPITRTLTGVRLSWGTRTRMLSMPRLHRVRR